MTSLIKYLICILTTSLIVSCIKSNKNVFQEVADVKIPTTAKVINDE